MRRVTSRTAFGLQRRMFEGERPLLVGVTLNASRISAGSQPRLFQFKAAVRIVAIAALHHTFEHLVMKRSVEIRLRFSVATHAELRLANFQHMDRREAWLLGVRRCHKSDRARNIFL